MVKYKRTPSSLPGGAATHEAPSEKPASFRAGKKRGYVMKTIATRAAAVLLLAAMLFLLVACDHTHVDKEVKEICEQAFGSDSGWTLEEQDWYNEQLFRIGCCETHRSCLPGPDNMTTYTAVLALYTYWDGLDIETTKYTVTRNFQAKMMMKNVLESLSRQASGEDARAAILRQRNELADIAGLPKLKTK